MFNIIYIYILIIVALETSAMTCFKKSLSDPRFFAIGVLFYACVGFLLCKTFTLSGMAMTNAIWSALSVASTTTVGVLLYKEILHMHDYIAIGLIVSGVTILNATK